MTCGLRQEYSGVFPIYSYKRSFDCTEMRQEEEHVERRALRRLSQCVGPALATIATFSVKRKMLSSSYCFRSLRRFQQTLVFLVRVADRPSLRCEYSATTFFHPQ